MNTTTDHQESASEPLATDTQGAAMRERLLIAADSLRDDGEVVEISDNQSLRLIVQPDRVMDIREDEFLGTFGDSLRSINGYGESRPKVFTGNAEKLHFGCGHDSIWWEPPTDMKRTDPHFPKLRHSVLDLLENGYVGVSVELLEGVDAHYEPIVRDVESLWGVESTSFDRDQLDYISEIVGELVMEIAARNGLLEA